MRISTSVKVACGYIVLTGLMLGAVYYIYTQTAELTKVSDTELMQTQRRKIIHQLVSKQFETENIGQTIRMGHWEAYRTYTQSLDDVQQTIHALDPLTDDTLQKARLDTLSVLLENKKENMRQLLIALENDEPNRVYRRQIDKLIEKKKIPFHNLISHGKWWSRKKHNS